MIEIHEETPSIEGLYEYLYASDLLHYNKPSNPGIVTVASTAFQCLGSGCPMVTFKSSFVETLNGAVYKYENNEELRACIASVFEKDRKYEEIIKNAKEYIEKNSAINVAKRPEEFYGTYVMYHRIPPHIWVAYSEDLRHWYNSNIVLSPQYEWEHFKIGTGGAPIKTDYGWLVIYHAVDRKMVYRLGYAIMAIDDPTNVIYRHPEPILEPEKEFETQGDVSNVVFTCGAVLIRDTVFVYYGGADTVICVATEKLEDFLRPVKLWKVL